MSTAMGFFEQVNRNFDRAAQFTNYPSGLLEQIKVCNSICHIAFPIKKDDGSLEVIHGWRAEHSYHKLPVKGGIRRRITWPSRPKPTRLNPIESPDRHAAVS